MANQIRTQGNLPAERTSFIGRRREMAELRSLFSSARLVTLVGPGGVGKTRLAIRAATDFRRGFREGAWLVELAEIQDPSLIEQAALGALGLRDQAAAHPMALLGDYLADKDLLLVVDNCEHLVEACARIADKVLKRAPNVRIIATSRQPLTVDGESILPVPPLELPGDDPHEPLERIRENEAVRLFCERAAAASGEFHLSNDNRQAVVQLCRRLDGVPLAIELAAVRTRVLSVEEILERLSDRFALLAGANRAALSRQQTLRTTIDWSYDLLDGEEQMIFRKLSVFAGTFDLATVQALVHSTRTPILGLITALVEKSLVVRDSRNVETRYRLLDSMRDYGLGKLQSAGEADDTKAAHLASFHSLAEDFRQRFWTPGIASRLHHVDLEYPNIQVALQFSLGSPPNRVAGAQLAWALHAFWFSRRLGEGQHWLRAVLDAGPLPPRESGRLRMALGSLAMQRGELKSARRDIEEALLLARRAGDRPTAAWCLIHQGNIDAVEGHFESAQAALAHAASAFELLHDVEGGINCLQAQATVATLAGDFQTSGELLKRAKSIGEEADDKYGLSRTLTLLGAQELEAGNAVAATSYFDLGLALKREVDDRLGIFMALAGLARAAAMLGDDERAARLVGAALSLGRRIGADRAAPKVKPAIDAVESTTRLRLGTNRYEHFVSAGSEMSLPEAVAFGLRDKTKRATPDDPGVATPLGNRETEIAQLVASGLTNKAIGSRLFISERTVETHIRNVLNKLGFNSRAQIASWASSGNSKNPN